MNLNRGSAQDIGGGQLFMSVSHSGIGGRAASDAMYHLGQAAGDDYPRLWDDTATIMQHTARQLVPRAHRLASRRSAARYLGWAAAAISVALWLAVLVAGWSALKRFIAVLIGWSDTSGSLLAQLQLSFEQQSSSLLVPLVLLGCALIASLLRRTLRSRHRASTSRTQEELLHIGCTGISDAIEARRDMERHSGRRGPSGQLCAAPFAHPEGIDSRTAEFLVTEWIRYLGDPEAVTTQATRDGGIDVVSPRYIAQVKHWVGTVPVGAVRELAGVASSDGRRPLFFTSGGFTKDAVAFADGSGIPLFLFNPYLGTLRGSNGLGASVLERGL